MGRRASLVAGLLVGLAVTFLFRRRGFARRERVDLYYADGSMVSLENGASEAAPILGLARDVLERGRAAR